MHATHVFVLATSQMGFVDVATQSLVDKHATHPFVASQRGLSGLAAAQSASPWVPGSIANWVGTKRGRVNVQSGWMIPEFDMDMAAICNTN